MAQDPSRAAPLKGRGAASNPEGRFQRYRREAADDGWEGAEAESPGRPATELSVDRSRSVITRNRSPDLPFDRSINPYRGCEHVIFDRSMCD